jgi:hypothetical protein
MYRGDADPDATDESSLARELAKIEQRARAMRDALDAARTRRRARRGLPVLEDLRVASPCDARWDDMTGDERARFCGKCGKNVYDLSAMTRAEAEALLARSGEAPCVRFFRRADGTVMTSDCPVGRRRKIARRMAGGAAALALTMATTATMAATCTMGEPMRPRRARAEPTMTMGGIATPTQAHTPTPTPTPTPNPPRPR